MTDVAGRAVAVVLPLTILTLAAASGSVVRLWTVARAGRWALLLLLCGLAIASLRGRRVPPTTAWLLAGLFVLLALESAAWSVAPRSTVEHAVTFGLVFVTAVALAAGVGAAVVLDGILTGATLVALAGLVVVAVARHDGLQAANAGTGWRFQGFGQNPNTVPMLLGVAAPIAVWWLLTRRGAWRAAAVAILLLFAGEIGFSGSRGSVVSAVGGALVCALLVLRSARARAVAAVAVVVAGLVCVELAKLPQPAAVAAAPAGKPAAKPVKTKGIDAELVFRQQDEIGYPSAYLPPPKRTLFGSSGRAQAWSGAFRQGEQRPAAGYGFATEERVFVDRFFSYESLLVENGYLGLFLQVGAIGLALFVVLLAVLLWDGVRAARTQSVAAAATGVLVAAMLVELVQTGFLAVGNIASAAIWLAVLPLALLARERA